MQRASETNNQMTTAIRAELGTDENGSLFILHDHAGLFCIDPDGQIRPVSHGEALQISTMLDRQAIN
jgi:hypothetical protein